MSQYANDPSTLVAILQNADITVQGFAEDVYGVGNANIHRNAFSYDNAARQAHTLPWDAVLGAMDKINGGTMGNKHGYVVMRDETPIFALYLHDDKLKVTDSPKKEPGF